jgi:CheY-like chemotaxis protein
MTESAHQPHILVLNSSEAFLQLMQELLTEEGYRITTDTKVGETTDEVIAINPDLVIVDFVWVSDQSGWQFMQLLKLDPRTRHIPAILCTAGVQEAEKLRPHLEAKGICIVYKPFDLDDILAAIKSQLVALR